MADPALAQVDQPEDWKTPGFLADTSPDAIPAPRATPSMALRPVDETPFDSSAALAGLKKSNAAQASTPPAAAAPSENFDSAASLDYLTRANDALSTAAKFAPAVAAENTAMAQWPQVQQRVADESFDSGAALSQLMSANTQAEAASDITQYGGLGVSPLGVAGQWAARELGLSTPKTTTAVPLPPPQEAMPGWTGGPENALNAEGRTIVGAIGSGVQVAAQLLSMFDPSVMQADDSTNHYVQAAVNFRSKINQAFPEDPNRPVSSTVGNIAGMVLPVAVTGGAAAAPLELSSPALLGVGARGIGGGMFGAQMFTGAADQGASPQASMAAGAAGFGLGALLPSTSLFHGAPALASATWGQLAKAYTFGPLLQASKGYFEMAGINTAAGEISNAVLPADKQQSQSQVLYQSTLAPQSVAMGAVGGLTHVLSQTLAEHAVSRAAGEIPGPVTATGEGAQDKAQFIVNTAAAIDAIAKDPAKTPVQKMSAVAEFMSSFSPSAQAAISAHVANVGDTIASIRKAAADAVELAKTNPQTAPVLAKEAQDAAVAKMQQKATAIEEQADAVDEAAKAWQAKAEAVAPRPPPFPEAKTAEPAAAEATPMPKQESPVPDGMASDEYDALAAKLANSPDPDIQARARQLLGSRQQALQEHAAADSPARQAELAQEVLNHEEALRALAEEPVHPAPIIPSRVEPPRTPAYAEYSNPLHVEPPPQEEKPQAKAEEPAPVAKAEPERPASAESAPAVAADAEGKVVPATLPTHIDEALSSAEKSVASGDLDGAEGHLNRAAEGLKDVTPEVQQLAKDRYAKITKDLDAARQAEAAKVVTPDLKTLKRDDLEKIAADEGHRPEAIAAAKTAEGLREMIEAGREARRVMATPVTRTDDLVKDGTAKNAPMIDPKIEALPKEYREAVKAFINSAKRWGLRGIRNFVLDTTGNGNAAFVVPRSGNFDTVYIDPISLLRDRVYAKSQKNVKAGGVGYYAQVTFSEEWIHNQTGTLLYKMWQAEGSKGNFVDYYNAKYKAIHDRMPQTERDKTQSDYGQSLTPEAIGEEYFRGVIQEALGGEKTESAIAKIRANRPLRTLVQAVADRFRGILRDLSKPDAEIKLIADKLDQALGRKTAAPEEAAAKEAAGEGKAEATGVAPLAPEHERPSDDDIWATSDHGVPKPQPRPPQRTAEDLAKYHPFVRPGETPIDMPPRPEETPQEQRAVPSHWDKHEELLQKRVESLAHIDLPEDFQKEKLAMAEEMARKQFSNPAMRDVALGNAKVKLLIRAKEYLEKNGNLDKFGAYRIIKNSFNDYADRIRDEGKGKVASDIEKAPPVHLDELEPTPEGEEPKLPGVDVHEDDIEKQQQQFEGTGAEELQAPVTTRTPATSAQEKLIAKNVQDIKNQVSPYGERLLDIFANTPKGRPSAFEPWVNKAADELKLPRAKIMADMDALLKGLHDEATARGLTHDDFLATGSAPLIPESFGKRMGEDERVSDNFKAALGSPEYERITNQAANAEKNRRVGAIPGVEISPQEEAEYHNVTNVIANGRPTPADNLVAQHLILKWEGSENGELAFRAAQLATLLSKTSREFGQFTQAARCWSKLGANGVLDAYDKIIRPVIDKVSEPFKPVIAGIETAIKSGREEAMEATIKRLQALIDRFQGAGNETRKGGGGGNGGSRRSIPRPDNPDQDIWHSYIEDTAEALSKVDLGPRMAQVKGPFEEFNARLKANLTKLLNEDRSTPAKQPRAILSPDAKLSEIYRNEPEYKEAWDYARAHIEAKYAEDPETLQLFNGALDKAFKAPVKLHDQAILNEFRLRGTTLRGAIRNNPDVAGLKAGVIHDVANRVSDDPAQRARIEAELGPRFDALHQEAADQNRMADEQQARIAQAKQKAVAEGMPLWQRYVNDISDSLSNLVKDSKVPAVKGTVQEFASRVAANLRSLVNENQIDAALKKQGLTAEQKISEIYQHLPAYKQAWDSARNAMRDKIGNDTEKLKQFDAVLSKAFEAPVKLTDKVLNNALKASSIKIADVVKQWAGSQEMVKQRLIDDLKSRIGLTPEQAKALGEAISTRFVERLQAARKDAVAKILRQSDKPRIANEAPALSKKIFEAINLGMADHDAVWNALATKLNLPKYDPAVAADLKKQANEIQAEVAKNGPSFITYNKTRKMMGILANEAQKHFSYFKQFTQGEMSVFMGNLFGLPTYNRKMVSENLNMFSGIGTMALAQMRKGDIMAIPRSYAAMMSGLMNRGRFDFVNIIVHGEGMSQSGADVEGAYGGTSSTAGAHNLTERGKTFGSIPYLKALNKPLSLTYRYSGRFLSATQAFCYAGNMQARASMLAWEKAMDMKRNGEIPDDANVGEAIQEILGNSSELHDQYLQQAASEGLTGRLASMRAQELAEQHLPEALRNEASRFAVEQTFMSDPSDGLTGIPYKAAKYAVGIAPPLKLLLPVIRIPTNVLKNWISYTPFGFGTPNGMLGETYKGSGAWRFAQEGRYDEMYQQIAKMTIGTMGAVGVAALYGSGIQGNGPKDYELRKTKMAEGWRPNTIQIGKNFYSYREWPNALMMNALGNYFDQVRYHEGDDGSLLWRLGVAMVGTMQFGFSSSWAAGVNNMLAIADPKNMESLTKSLTFLAGSTAGSLIPFNQKNLQVLDQWFNPKSYPPNSVMGTLMSHIAVVRQLDNGNEPALNAFGDPLEVSPFAAFVSIQSSDPVWSLLAEKNIKFGGVPSGEQLGVGEKGRPLTPEERRTLTQTAGTAMKDWLYSGGMDTLQNLDNDQAEALFKSTYAGFLKTGKAALQTAAVKAGENPKPKKSSYGRLP